MRLSRLVVATLLTVASAVHGQSQKAAAPQSDQAQRRAGDIMLASADSIHAPAPQATVPATLSAPAKHRIVRVTTCRCGDPVASPETPDR